MGALAPAPFACAKGLDMGALLLPPALKVNDDAPDPPVLPPPPPAPKLNVEDAPPVWLPPKLKSKLCEPVPVGVAPKDTAGEALLVLPPKLKEGAAGAAGSEGLAPPNVNDGVDGLLSAAA